MSQPTDGERLVGVIVDEARVGLNPFYRFWRNYSQNYGKSGTRRVGCLTLARLCEQRIGARLSMD